MAGSVTLGGLSSNLITGGSKTIGPLTDVGTTIIGGITDASLSSGDNTFTVPTGASRVVVALGSNPTATVKIRTNLDSYGIEFAPYAGNCFLTLPLPSGVTSVVLNASTSVTGVELSFI